MRVLLASFHFGTPDTSLVVAYVYCEPHQAIVEPVHSALEGSRIIRQLRELADGTGPEAYVRLMTCHSPDWTFDDAAIH